MTKILILFLAITANAQQENLNIYEIPNVKILDQTTLDEETDEELYLEQAKSVQTITTSQIKNKNASHVSELLKQTPGVEVIGGSQNSFKKIVIRGLEDQRIITTVDGAQRREQTQSTMPSELGIEPEMLKSIDIQKGADSVKNGNGAIGGAVAFKTLSARDVLENNKTSTGKIKYSANPRTKGRDFFVLGAAKISREHSFLSAYSQKEEKEFTSGKNDEGQRIEQKQKSARNNILIKTEHQIAPRHVLKLKYDNYKSKSFDASFYDSTFDDSTTYSSNANEYALTYKYSPVNKQLGDINLLAYQNDKKNERIVTSPYKSIESTVGQTTDKNRITGATAQAQTTLALSRSTHILSKHDLTYTNESIEEISSEAISYYGKSRGRDISFANESEFLFLKNKVSLNLGGRYNSYERSSDKLAIDVSNKNGNFFSKSLGLTYRPIENIAIFGRVADSFRAPSLRELYQGGDSVFGCHWPRKICSNNPNPSLNEETAYSREIGFSTNFKKTFTQNDKLNFKVTYFNEDIKDYIQHMPFMYKVVDGKKIQAGPSDATHREYAARNQSLVIRQGFEFSLKYNLYDLEIRTSYSAQNATCVDCVDMFNANGITEPLYNAPADKLSLGFDYSVFDRAFQFGASAIFVSTQDRLSERYIQAGYTTEGYKSYEIHFLLDTQNDFVGEYQIGLNVNNIFDKSYTVHGSPTGKEEAGRDYKVQFSKIF